MITIQEYLLSKKHNKLEHVIHATDETIQQIVKDELDRLGHDADLNHIDVSKVTNMASLFSCAVDDYLGQFMKYEDLNPDISEWDVSNVKNMDSMFWGCKQFNCDISNWNVNNVKNHDRMFMYCPIKEEFKPKFKD